MKREMTWLSKLGGRRFIITLGCGAVCTILVWHHKISGDVFEWTVIGTVGAYIGGNTWQAISQMKNGIANDVG